MKHLYTILYTDGKDHWEVWIVKSDSHYHAEQKAIQNTPKGYSLYGVFYQDIKELDRGEPVCLTSV